MVVEQLLTWGFHLDFPYLLHCFLLQAVFGIEGPAGLQTVAPVHILTL